MSTIVRAVRRFVGMYRRFDFPVFGLPFRFRLRLYLFAVRHPDYLALKHAAWYGNCKFTREQERWVLG